MPTSVSLPSLLCRSAAREAGGPSAFLHVFVLIAIVVVVYVILPSDLTIRGEESRRATVAMAMTATSDWIVPRQQGDPNFMSARPPLQSWLIAIVGMVRGQVDAVAIRLPSAMAVLLTVLLIYYYCGTFLSGTGAFAAAAAFATMGQVMELGRLGETDALFTLFISSSLLLWHAGITRRWNRGVTWSMAWLSVALAALTKGPQAPVYFIGSVAIYLLMTRQWRIAFTWSNVLGMTVAIVVTGIWHVPFILTMGLDGLRHVYTGDVSLYLKDWNLGRVAEHYTTFPIRVLGSLLPWSLFFLYFANEDIRLRLSASRDHLLFLAVCLTVSFMPLWLVPGAHTRFFMCMYPCLAVLLGVVIDRSTQGGSATLWSKTLAGCAIGFAAFGTIVAGASILAPGTPILAQPRAVAFMVVLASFALGALAWWSRTAGSGFRASAGVLSIATFTGLVYAGLVTNHLVQRSVDTAAQLAELKRRLPHDVHLESIGTIPHLFAYHYKEPIPMRPPLTGGEAIDSDVFFCTVREPSFPYEEIARINCDRNQSASPQNVVIVGRSCPPMLGAGIAAK